MSGLQALAELLRDEGGLVGGAVVSPEGEDDVAVPAPFAATGPRTSGRDEDYALVIEAVYEGYLLHYGGARVVRSGDPDLDLLAGDQLYALGLARLVALQDLEGVRELADVISLTAAAQADGDGALAAAVWRAGARAIGWGADPRHELAKDLVRRGVPDATAALHRFAEG